MKMIDIAFRPDLGFEQDNFTAVLPMNSSAYAVMDLPVNVFVWDLLDAFPNATVSVTLRTVRTRLLPA